MARALDISADLRSHVHRDWVLRHLVPLLPHPGEGLGHRQERLPRSQQVEDKGGHHRDLECGHHGQSRPPPGLEQIHLRGVSLQQHGGLPQQGHDGHDLQLDVIQHWLADPQPRHHLQSPQHSQSQQDEQPGSLPVYREDQRICHRQEEYQDQEIGENVFISTYINC